MITKEKTKAFIDRAYACAVNHGFHGRELSVEHSLMLVITEISEAVEADRKGKREAPIDPASYMKYEHETAEVRAEWLTFLYNANIKGTVEEELADVCIRLYDTCGMMDIEPTYYDYGIKGKTFQDIPYRTFTERCFFLCTLITNCDVDVRDAIGSSLQFVYCMCADMGIDIERHIELKMEYNESRPMKHGKKY